MNLSDKTATKAFKQLNEVGLVQEKRQGLGKPNLIYVGKIQHEETENLHLLKEELENKEKELELKFENKAYNMEHEYKKEIHKLKQENKQLNKVIDKFKVTLKRFIKWLCHKFSYPSEDELIRDFETENHNYTNPIKQLKFEAKQKEIDIDL